MLWSCFVLPATVAFLFTAEVLGRREEDVMMGEESAVVLLMLEKPERVVEDGMRVVDAALSTVCDDAGAMLDPVDVVDAVLDAGATLDTVAVAASTDAVFDAGVFDTMVDDAAESTGSDIATLSDTSTSKPTLICRATMSCCSCPWAINVSCVCICTSSTVFANGAGSICSTVCAKPRLRCCIFFSGSCA